MEETLPILLQQEWAGEAIRTASPSFHAQWQTDPALTNPKLRLAALKYALRMGTRCTPFGLFAGCTVGRVGRVGPSTAIDFSHRLIRPWYRLDGQVLSMLARFVSEHPVWREQVRFWPNSGLYPIGAQLRYTEITGQEPPVTHCLSQIEATPAVLRVLRLAHQGATITDLLRQMTKSERNTGEVRAFIEQLIRDQVLVSELTPHVTGPDFFDSLIERVARWPGSETLTAPWYQIRSLLQLSAGNGEQSPAIRALLEDQLGAPLPTDTIVQCDVFFETPACHLSQTVLNSLQPTLLRVAGLFHAGRPTPVNLALFRERFTARYQEKEVPLAVVLDGETGIGYGSDGALLGENAFLEGLISPAGPPDDSPAAASLHPLLLDKYADWLAQGSTSITLTHEDVARLSPERVRLPDCYCALGYLLAPSAEAIDTGNYHFVLKGMSGPSAFTMMGRFCHGDPQLATLVQEHLAQTQQRDSERIYAEVAHLPSPRADNVLHRPHLHAYEIPYLTRSTLPPDQQIPLSDLLVSVPGGNRIVLRSKRLAKEVIPRLTTAHAYTTGLPVYRFLGDLQHQDGSLAAGWQWGHLAPARRLPRVQYEQVILAEARWQLTQTDWKAHWTDAENVMGWRTRWFIPRYIALVQADNELVLDLEAPACQQLLIATLRRLTTLTLIEWLQTPDRCWIVGPSGKMTHEVIIPFTNPVNEPAPPTPRQQEGTVQRTFLPGSDWVYLKVYCGYQTATDVLRNVARIAGMMVRGKQISHWFFIRYEDPEPHLRIRLLRQDMTVDALLGAYRTLLEPLVKSGSVHSLQVATYERELERYSPALMEPTEWLFWIDSRCMARVHHQSFTDDQFLAAGVLSVVNYLADAGFDTAQMARFCEEGFSALVNEQGDAPQKQRTLATAYRANQPLIERLVIGKMLSLDEQVWQRLFKQRSQQNKPYLTTVLSSPGRPKDYLFSLIHLSLNRLFSRHQRTYELLVYHHLHRTYRSLIAQKA